jgi:Tol biopolymer transport system component
MDETGSDIWKVPSSGGTSERVTNNAGRGPEFFADMCRISPDGRTLYYKQADGDAPLVARALDSGVERVVIDCVFSRSFEIGPRGVYYVGCTSAERAQPVMVFDAATGRSEVLGAVESVGTGLAVSPDGKTLLVPLVAPKADIVMIENFR